MLQSSVNPVTLLPVHAPTWYADDLADLPHWPSLAGDHRVEVAVIGGGFTGLTTALNLAEAGIRVALIEAKRIGWGGSGRNGGQLVPGYSVDLASLVRLAGEAEARALFDLAEQGRQLLAARIARHAIACDLRWGYLHAAIKPRHMDGLAAEKSAWERWDYPGLTLWDRDQMRKAIGSERYRGGLYDPNGGHLQPLALALGLAQAASAAGADCYEASPAIALDLAAGIVTTPGGRLIADRIVLASDGELGSLAPWLRRRTLSIVSCLIATAPLPRDIEPAVMPAGLAVADTNHVLDYFRTTADGRLLFGGLARYDGTQPADIAAALRPHLARVFPQAASVPITHAWGGRIAITRNRLPHLGRIGARGLFAQGWSGHGLILTHLAGHLIARAIQNDDADFQRFAQLRHRPFPPGPLRRASMIGATAYFRLLDRL